KSNYPKIIVDVISVINQGIDTRGTKVNVIGLDKYYQSRKELGTTTTTEEEKKTQTSIPKIAASAIHKEKITLSNNKDVVEILAQITNRAYQYQSH
ncbi:MAG TPA: hypothetical protein VE619_09355, partial [Nitrososphaeraceae archaeon]|nr:hypothetical protein [Nitrososphaeraceae archaeon]